MLAPRWTQWKIGHLLRGEADSRIYHNLFRDQQGEIAGIKGAFLGMISRSIDEPESLVTPVCASGSLVVTFRGELDHFSRLNGWDQELYSGLRAITQPRWLRAIDHLPDNPIGIHVRRGDFFTPSNISRASHPRRCEDATYLVHRLRESDPCGSRFAGRGLCRFRRT